MLRNYTKFELKPYFISYLHKHVVSMQRESENLKKKKKKNIYIYIYILWQNLPIDTEMSEIRKGFRLSCKEE